MKIMGLVTAALFPALTNFVYPTSFLIYLTLNMAVLVLDWYAHLTKFVYFN